MIKQIKSSEIENYIKENSNVVLLDVRTENEWTSLGKPNAEDLNSKTYFVTVSPDLSNWQVPDPNFVENVKKYMQGGYGSLVGMDLGTKEAGAKFIDNLKMLYHVANIGDARSLAIHPATTTHSQLDDAALAAAGVTPGYVRLSIGIEHPDDIIADIKQALAA